MAFVYGLGIGLIIALIVGIIFSALAIKDNQDWYKICSELNTDWYNRCNELVDEFYAMKQKGDHDE